MLYIKNIPGVGVDATVRLELRDESILIIRVARFGHQWLLHELLEHNQSSILYLSDDTYVVIRHHNILKYIDLDEAPQILHADLVVLTGTIHQHLYQPDQALSI